MYITTILDSSLKLFIFHLPQEKLGEWIFKSKSQEKFHEGSMFPLYVTEELEVWPEKNLRHRVWVCPQAP